MSYYAVYNGRIPGIYETWSKCQEQVTGFPAAKFKKFKSVKDAEHFYQNGHMSIPTTSTTLTTSTTTTTTTLPYTLPTTSINNTLSSSSNFVNIYTDGSFVKKQDKCGCGYGIYIPTHNIEISKILVAPKTNNRAELTAIIEAIKLFDKTVPLHIYTDSKYSILIGTSTGLKYQKNGFLTRNKRGELVNVINRDLIEQLLPLIHDYDISFTHILAHTGLTDPHSVGNNIADKLAGCASNHDLIINNS